MPDETPRREHKEIWVVLLALDGQWRVQAAHEDLADCFEEAHHDDPVRTWEVTVRYGGPAWLYAPPSANSGGWLIVRETLNPAGSGSRGPFPPDEEVDNLEPPPAPA